MDPRLRLAPDAAPTAAVTADGRLPVGAAGLRPVRCTFLRAQERLCYVGQRGRCVHFIGGGAFKLVRPCADGEDFLVGFRFRNECVGMEALTGARYRYEAVALGDAWVCSVSTESLAHCERGTYQRTLDAFASEVEHARERCFLLSRPSACERIAIFLHDLGRRLAEPGERVQVIDLPMSREDVACYLSVTRETVSRTLASLQGRDLIAVSRRRITLLQPAVLARIAHAGEGVKGVAGGKRQRRARTGGGPADYLPA